jgi:hypothetical protein
VSESTNAETTGRKSTTSSKASSASADRDGAAGASNEEGTRKVRSPTDDSRTVARTQGGPAVRARSGRSRTEKRSEDLGPEGGTTSEAVPDEGHHSDSRPNHDHEDIAEKSANWRMPLVVAAQRAAQYIGVLTGHHPESVVSAERRKDGYWHVGVEVVETRRIPDSADILAIYEVLVRPSGELISYRRVRRYARGQVDRPWR